MTPNRKKLEVTNDGLTEQLDILRENLKAREQRNV